MNNNDIDLYIGANRKRSELSENYVINRYWYPNNTIIKIIEKICLTNNFKKNLEIGPGVVPFSLATSFIGCNETINKDYIDIDIDKDIFPFDEKSFDFIYCRHVLEDIQNPDFALQEIFRITKGGGYIETPSPLIEITKGVDGSEFTNSYCGYIHHRYIVWSNIEKNEIYFLPKYSCVLDNIFKIENESKSYVYNLINNYPVYWNNYFVFNGENKPNIIMYKNGVNFNTKNGDFIKEYINLVGRAINESLQNTNFFICNYKNLLI